MALDFKKVSEIVALLGYIALLFRPAVGGIYRWSERHDFNITDRPCTLQHSMPPKEALVRAPFSPVLHRGKAAF